MTIRHMIAAGLLIGASMAHAAPITTTSNVAGWTIQDSQSSWLPFFAPVLSTASDSATGHYALLQNKFNGIVVHLTSMANVLGIGLFVGPDGKQQHGFILREPVKLPAPAPAPAPAPVVDPVASSGDTPASVADEVAAGSGAAAPLLDTTVGGAPVAEPVAVPLASQVPEPATGMLLLAGLAGAGLIARRRRR